MLRRCAFPAWHFLWFWICSLIRSWLVCVVSISILCISDLILTCSRIQKKGISATFQIFSKKKKVPKNQHFFIYYPCFLDINTTHSTCNDTYDMITCMSLLCRTGNNRYHEWVDWLFFRKFYMRGSMSIIAFLAGE